ncbi:MAG: S41 family peptidase [Acidobacteria bacterium]|nr:S41 family peptidase [Acidobacteriota bacterium]MBI3655643.1 S41 family peptidase [Acidobacteriota bacterium]
MKLDRFSVIILSAVLSAALLGGLLGNKVSAGSSADVSIRDLMKPFTEAIDVIDKNYVDKIGSDKVVYSAVRGMLRSLDPHSTFFESKEFSKLREEQTNKYSGLGIRVRSLFQGGGRVVVYEPPFSGSPAQKRGLRAGDIITRIEGQLIDDWSLDEVVGRLKGPRGSKVNITVERPGLEKPMEIEIERDDIQLQTIQYAFMLRPGIGYIKLERFSESTGDDLERKIKEIAEKDGTRLLKGLILDLRDNHGGLLKEGVEVTDKFISQGEIVVTTKGRSQKSETVYKAPSRSKRTFPLVVLINNGSASASEIVAGAIQDHDRGLLVGETTFGKGLVQSVYPLDDHNGLALTTARWYTPSGRLIQRDYSSSSAFDYLLPRKKAKSESETNREVKFTDSGRKVLGGGGITPDVLITARELSRFERILLAKDAFAEFARRVLSGKVSGAGRFARMASSGELTPEQASQSLSLSEPLLEDFKAFLKEKSIDFSDKDFTSNLVSVKRNIQREIFTSLFGMHEGFKVVAEGDEQLLKGIELLPEAEKLMATARNAIANKRTALK